MSFSTTKKSNARTSGVIKNPPVSSFRLIITDFTQASKGKSHQKIHKRQSECDKDLLEINPDHSTGALSFIHELRRNRPQ
jgi:hypothetical protein